MKPFSERAEAVARIAAQIAIGDQSVREPCDGNVYYVTAALRLLDEAERQIAERYGAAATEETDADT